MNQGDRAFETAPAPPAPWGHAQFLAAVVESSQDAIITKDLDGIVTSWNPAATAIFGYSAEEMIGRSILELFPPRLYAEEYEIRHRLRAGGEVSHHYTMRLTRDGRELPVSVTLSPIHDEAGTVIGASTILRDISEQHAREEARSHLAAIVNSSEDAIISKDLNGFVRSWNRAATAILGYEAEEMIGQSIGRIIPDELQAEEADILARVRRGEHVGHTETVRLRKDGTRVDVSLTVSPLRDSAGTVVGASKILRDISARKQMQALVLQAEKVVTMGRMAATIAHEINNPLESLVNLIYLARVSAENPADVRTYLETAERELERIARLARQRLGYYREPSRAEKLALAGLVRDALEVYGPRLRSAGIDVQLRLSSEAELTLRKHELSQVIANLLSNAALAMPAGGQLFLSLEPAVDAGEKGYVLLLRDTGVGIPEQNLERIFDAFFTTRVDVGTGFGLWITRQVVEEHGGRISVTSSTDPEHHGTEVRVFLPELNSYSDAVPASVAGSGAS